jgi:hypothetical protein
MPVVVLDVCPRCKTDVSRRLGLITTRTIACAKCGHEMRVTQNAVINNWQYHGAVLAFLVLWTGATVLILSRPDVAAEVGRRAALPCQTMKERATLALVAAVPILLCAMPFAVIGRVVGYYVAQRLALDATGEGPLADFEKSALEKVRQAREQPRGLGPASPQFPPLPPPGQRELVTQRLFAASAAKEPAPVRPAPPPPSPAQGAGCVMFVVRAFVCLLWAALFFVVGGVAMTAWASWGLWDNPPAQQQAAAEAGRVTGPWLLLGAIGLAIVFSCLGLLPGTRRRKR